MSIGKKIIIAYGSLVAFNVAVSIVALVRSRELNESARVLAARSLPGIAAAGRLAGIAKDIRGGIRGHITSANPEAKAKSEKDLAELTRTCLTELGKYERTISGERERELFDRLPRAFKRLSQSAVPIFPLSRKSLDKDAMELFRSETMPAYAMRKRRSTAWRS